MISLGETKGGIFGNDWYYLCNFSVNLELFQNKKFVRLFVFEEKDGCFHMTITCG